MKPSTVLFLLVPLVLRSAAAEVISEEFASPGRDATLNCSVGHDFIAVKWTRSDMDGYVFLFKDQRSDTRRQNEAFKGRVQLVDGQLRDGDASLLLKNVSASDAGTYECRVAQSSFSRTKRALEGEPFKSIRLTVRDTPEPPAAPAAPAGPAAPAAPAGPAVAVVAVVAVLVAVVVAVAGFLGRRMKRAAAEESKPSGGSEASETLVSGPQV